jgi:hypothetical protein
MRHHCRWCQCVGRAAISALGAAACRPVLLTSRWQLGRMYCCTDNPNSIAVQRQRALAAPEEASALASNSANTVAQRAQSNHPNRPRRWPPVARALGPARGSIDSRSSAQRLSQRPQRVRGAASPSQPPHGRARFAAEAPGKRPLAQPTSCALAPRGRPPWGAPWPAARLHSLAPGAAPCCAGSAGRSHALPRAAPPDLACASAPGRGRWARCGGRRGG